MKTKPKASSPEHQVRTQVQAKQTKQFKKVEKARAQLEKAIKKLMKIELAMSVALQPDQTTNVSETTLHPSELRHARIIFNPKSKCASNGTYRPDQIVACLRGYGIEAEIMMKTSGKAARTLVKQAVTDGVKLLIVAAGDGTIEDITGQLVGTETTLGIIPMGTMNNLARSLGVPLNLEDACALLSTGITRHIDVGRILTADKPKGVYFLEMAGIGLSAHALTFGQGVMKGQWVKLLEAMGNAFASKIGNIAISYDDEAAFEVQTHVVTIANAPLFAGNMYLGPDAKMDDGLLDVALYGGLSKIDLEHYFRTIAAGKRMDDPRITMRRVRRLRVSTQEALAANADLNVFAPQQHWDISIVPGALSVIVGNGIGLTLPVESALIIPPLTGPQPVVAAANGTAQSVASH